MADRLSYNQISEKIKFIDIFLNSEEINIEDKQELNTFGTTKTRQESKFDAIISVIKDCDKQMLREKEIIELKRNQNFENKRKNIINIIKKAYEHN